MVWYRNNRKRHIQTAYKNRQVARKTATKYVLKHFEKNLCNSCGESNPLVLEFNHIKGKKRATVSEMVVCGWGLKTIKKEISKCEVLCANCHRIKTAKQRGYLKYLDQSDL